MLVNKYFIEWAYMPSPLMFQKLNQIGTVEGLYLHVFILCFGSVVVDIQGLTYAMPTSDLHAQIIVGHFLFLSFVFVFCFCFLETIFLCVALAILELLYRLDWPRTQIRLALPPTCWD